MQTENPVYEEIQEILRAIELPSVALVGQRIDSPPALTNIREGVREALNSVELPSGSVAIGVGSRGVARIGEVVAALVEALKESGAEPFIVPAMGSHGASTAEGQAEVLGHLGVSEEKVGCPVRATMESVRLGETPSGVAVYMDRNAYEADSVVVVNRVKPHTAFRGTVESGPTKMLAIGLGKQRGRTPFTPRAGRTSTRLSRSSPCRRRERQGRLRPRHRRERRRRAMQDSRDPRRELEEAEAPLLEEAKRNLARLPFDEIDVLVVDEIGKNISGDGADPNVTGRYPTTAASGGPSVERMVYLGLTEETGGNANGLGMADVVTERLAGSMDRPSTYMNALTSTTPAPVKTPMVMPTDEMAIAAALTMCAGVTPPEARLVRIENTLKLGRIWVSEALIGEIENKNRLEILEDPQPMRFDEGEIIPRGA